MTQAGETWTQRRLANWRQTPETRIAGDEEAPELIDHLGLMTLYPASSEVPNLYHAYMGDPNAKTEAKWDSPSGIVYSWRWTLGRKEAGFYGVVVRKRPTFVSWRLLPAVLRLCADLRMPDELYDLGVISSAAYRITQALEAAGGALTTGELREAAGFPAGKEQRTAYLKAIEELDTRLLLAKFFTSGDDDAHHALLLLDRLRADPSPRWAVLPPSRLGSRLTSPSRRHGTGSGVESSGTQRPCSGAGGLVGCRRAVSGVEEQPRGGSASAAANPYYRTSHLPMDPLATHRLVSTILLASAQGTDAAAREPFRASRSNCLATHPFKRAHTH